MFCILNSYFTIIGSKLAAKFQTSNTHIDQTDLVGENVYFSQIYQSFVEKQLSTFCAAKATSIDSVNARLLKAAAPIIAPSITHMLNVSINRGSVPEEWKRAKVTPVYKYLTSKFSTVAGQHGHATHLAQSSDLKVPQPNLELYRKSSNYSEAVVWNSIQPSTRNADSCKAFKAGYCRSVLG